MGRAIDFERALKVSLPALPLSIARDFTFLPLEIEVTEKQVKVRCKMDVINPKGNENSAQGPSENNSDFVVHFIALVRTLTVKAKTFENLIWKIIKMFPVRCIKLHAH